MAATWFQTPPGGWGKFLGISHRNARRHIASLERVRRIERTGSGGWHRGEWLLATSGLDLRDDAVPRLRLELAPMATPAWGDGARRVWAALCWYADGSTLTCFPSGGTLANVAGLARRNVIRHLDCMERDGWIVVERRPGRSSTFVLFPENRHTLPPRIVRERCEAAAGADARRRVPLRKRKHGHQRHTPPAPASQPPRRQRHNSPGTSVTTSMPPASPELDLSTRTCNQEPSNENNVSACALGAHTPSRTSEGESAIKTRLPKAKAASGVIDERDPEVQRRREQARQLRKAGEKGAK